MIHIFHLTTAEVLSWHRTGVSNAKYSPQKQFTWPTLSQSHSLNSAASAEALGGKDGRKPQEARNTTG